MDWFRQGLAQFQTVPAADRIPVLLCGSSALEALKPTEYDSILDQSDLSRQVETLSRRLGTLWLDKCIAAISDLIAGVAIVPEGMGGRISFPIFPFRTANKEIVRRIQCISRDRIESATFAKFFGLFKKLPEIARPRVLFLNGDQVESANFFRDIDDLVDLYEVLPGRLSRVRPGEPVVHRKNYFDFLAAGSFTVASDQKLEFADAQAGAHVIQKTLVANYHVCMAQQRNSAAFSAQARHNVNELIRHVDHYLLHADKVITEFLISAKIQILLLKLLIEDDASQPLYEAISLSKAVENLAYEQKCLRFSNQIAGVSSYALDCLRQSSEALARVSEEENFNPLHRLEYFAVMQNIFITRLFNRKNIVDIGEAENCLEFATDRYRYFDELAMLANSVGLSCLVIGDLKQADKYLQLASTYGADRLTLLNIRINHLICHRLAGSAPSNDILFNIFNEYVTLPFEVESAYHAAMAFGNLWQLASDKGLKARITRLSKERGFIRADQHGSAIIPALKEKGFLFMKTGSFTGPYGALLEHSGFMPAFHFNWSTPVAEPEPR